MRYMLLVHLDVEEMFKQSREEWAQLDRDSLAYDEELRQRGHYLTSSALQDGHSAVIVRRDGDGIATTDGPFAETKEHLGGLHLHRGARPHRGDRHCRQDPGGQVRGRRSATGTDD